MPWLSKRWISFFAFSAAASFVIVVVVGWVNAQEGIKTQNTFESFGTIPDGDIGTNLATNWTKSNFALGALVNIDSFDPNSKTGPAISVDINYDPINNLPSVNGGDAPAVGIQVFVQQTTYNFTANATFPIQNIIVVTDGNPNSYPFDTYTGFLVIQAAVLQSGDPIPLTIYTTGAVQGFTTNTDFQVLQDGPDFDGSVVQLTYQVRRSNITRLFSAIIFILMWLLSLSIFIAAMSVWFRGKNTELPLVAISTALLFALPNIRNSQPGVPTVVGTTEDMVGFFWNILLVGTSAISLLIKYIIQNKSPGSKPATHPEAAAKV
jgi:hypothetical protein